MTLRDNVIATTAAMAAHIDSGENSIVEHLVSEGYCELHAEVLVAFVPLGLARAVIARIPVDSPIYLQDRATILGSHGKEYSVRLLDVPEFVTALELGEETFRTGIIPGEHFKSACSFSVELNLVNQMLFKEVELGGAVFSFPILLRLVEAPGFDDWYQTIQRKRSA